MHGQSPQSSFWESGTHSCIWSFRHDTNKLRLNKINSAHKEPPVEQNGQHEKSYYIAYENHVWLSNRQNRLKSTCTCIPLSQLYKAFKKRQNIQSNLIRDIIWALFSFHHTDKFTRQKVSDTPLQYNIQVYYYRLIFMQTLSQDIKLYEIILQTVICLQLVTNFS